MEDDAISPYLESDGGHEDQKVTESVPGSWFLVAHSTAVKVPWALYFSRCRAKVVSIARPHICAALPPAPHYQF